MFTHENVWHAIDRMAATFGYSASGLAKQAGLDSTTFNKSKRIGVDGKPRWPSTESIARILAATGATMADFLSLMDDEGEDQNLTRLPHHVPLIRVADAESDEYFDKKGCPAGDNWNEVNFPDFNTGEGTNTYALEIGDNTMRPLYRKGDIIVVSPEGRIRKGDRVVIKAKSGEIIITELGQQTDTQMALVSLNRKVEDSQMAVKDVSWIARIIWVSQ